jgi:ketosteroid isomerase-like protein
VSESDTRAAISALFDIIQQRDFGRFANLIHDDIDWIIHGPIEVFPFAGLRRGRPAVLQALAAMAQVYSLESCEPDFFIVEDDRAAIMADLALRQVATGRILRFRAANFVRIQDRKIIEFREFADSFDQVEQALGRLVELG